MGTGWWALQRTEPKSKNKPTIHDNFDHIIYPPVRMYFRVRDTTQNYERTLKGLSRSYSHDFPSKFTMCNDLVSFCITSVRQSCLESTVLIVRKHLTPTMKSGGLLVFETILQYFSLFGSSLFSSVSLRILISMLVSFLKYS